MEIWLLVQNDYYDFTTPDMVNSMVVRAETPERARELAQENEREFRDGTQDWSEKSASIVPLTKNGQEMVVIVA